jgi:hypothetical protein
MVTKRTRRATVLALLVAASAAANAWAGEPPVLKPAKPRGPGPVREALARGAYPWYDVASDRVKPVWPPREWNLDWLDRKLGRLRLGWLPSAGSLNAFLLAMVGLTTLLLVLVVLWRHYQPGPGAPRTVEPGWGAAARLERLPEGLRSETLDPWSEAVRCRARGDYAQAIVCLFAHQLLTLDRLQRLRLVPGRTGRQLVRGINDPDLHDWVETTLRHFEAVYYGRRIPSAESFAVVWSTAEAFQRRVAEAVVP